MTKALIDGDILVYAVGFSSEDEDLDAAILKMDTRIDEITFNCGASEYVIYLSGTSNFRKQLFPAYKAHRKQPRPKHYTALRDYLITTEGAVVSENEEADDLLGINQERETVICSIDKDLLMVEGWHYNWNRDEVVEITKADGLKNFYRQLITGDSTDNIPGQYGIGPKKANDILEGCETVEQYNKAVLDSYKKHFDYCSEEDVLKHINIIGKLLYIRRQPNEEWVFNA
jgi:5'-3' exonuclease